jgi:hypothetical protein
MPDKIIVSFIFLVKRVPGQGPEQRESEKTVLYPQIIIILISYIIINLLINKNHQSQNRKRNSSFICCLRKVLFAFSELPSIGSNLNYAKCASLLMPGGD